MDGDDALAQRLRELRMSALGSVVTQSQLASAFGIKPPTISSWESGKAVPSEKWLQAYATYFSTRSSPSQEALPRDTDLRDGEIAERDDLLRELTALLPADDETAPTAAGPSDFWAFPDGRPVRIICGQLPTPSPYATPGVRNYVKLGAYADLDSLVELFGHLRRTNPNSDVQFILPDDVEADDLTATHLVLLGNLARSQSVLPAWMPTDLPVWQQADPALGDDGEVFVVDGEQTFGPRAAPEGSLVEFAEDVGLLARMPSPLDQHRTLTICSGVFTRGVYAAVRATTDLRVAQANTAFLRNRFAGASTFGLLMRVRTGRTVSPTPRLDDDNVRLFEFHA